MTQGKSHSGTAFQPMKNAEEKLLAENWVAMCSLHRLLQLGDQEKTQDELVTRINNIFKPRLGQRRLRITYTKADGLTVYCGSRQAVPVLFMNAATHAHQVDSEWNILNTWKSV